MKRLVVILTMLILGGAAANTAAAQQIRVPDQEDILLKIMPLDSPYFYPAMMERYMEGDTTLTDDHYYYLYYGYAYQEGFDGRKALPGQADMEQIVRRAGEAISREDAAELIEAARRNMEVDPFSPSGINMMTWACGVVGDSLGARVNSHRFEGIIRAITSSGTGARERSPWHILRFSHAADIVEFLGHSVANRQVRSRSVEYIQVGRNRAGVKGYFFDFSRVYW